MREPYGFRLTPAEREFLQAVARQVGITTSEFIRSSALQAAEVIAEMEARVTGSAAEEHGVGHATD